MKLWAPHEVNLPLCSGSAPAHPFHGGLWLPWDPELPPELYVSWIAKEIFRTPLLVPKTFLLLALPIQAPRGPPYIHAIDGSQHGNIIKSLLTSSGQ